MQGTDSLDIRKDKRLARWHASVKDILGTARSRRPALCAEAAKVRLSMREGRLLEMPLSWSRAPPGSLQW